MKIKNNKIIKGQKDRSRKESGKETGKKNKKIKKKGEEDGSGKLVEKWWMMGTCFVR